MVFNARLTVLLLYLILVSEKINARKGELKPLWKVFKGGRAVGGCDDKNPRYPAETDSERLEKSYKIAIDMARDASTLLESIQDEAPNIQKDTEKLTSSQIWTREEKMRNFTVAQHLFALERDMEPDEKREKSFKEPFLKAKGKYFMIPLCQLANLRKKKFLKKAVEGAKSEFEESWGVHCTPNFVEFKQPAQKIPSSGNQVVDESEKYTSSNKLALIYTSD